jgi:hypothetical protein
MAKRKLEGAEALLAEVLKAWNGNSPEVFLRAVEKAMRYLRARARARAGR